MLEMPQTSHHKEINNELQVRLSHRFEVTNAVALFKFAKSSRVQHILHALKYKNRPEVGVMLGKVLGQKLADASIVKPDIIIPVPLHPSRKRKRGYNQSAKFAEGLAVKLNIPFSDTIITRLVKTDTQTKKNKLNRWQNVSEVFYVKDPFTVKGKRILLVDDVVTTGATIEACAHILKQNGCAEINIACIAEA
jgi:ComF family protein